MKYKLFYMILGLLAFIGCDDSESLSPTLESEPVYSLPQGSHDYDSRIMDWHERCDFYILYKFEPRDLYYNMGGSWLGMTIDTLSRTVRFVIDEDAFVDGESILVIRDGDFIDYQLGEHTLNGFWYKASIDGNNVVIEEEYLAVKSSDGGFTVEQPDEEYVGDQLEWLENMFLNLYQDSLLKKLMPLKVILGKNLRKNVNGKLPAEAPFYSVSNVFVLSHGDESIVQMTLKEKQKGKEDLNRWFLIDKLFNNIYPKVKADGFYEGMDYSVFKLFMVPSDTIYPCGVVNYGGNDYRLSWNHSDQEMMNRDLKSYICMAIDHSSQELNAAVEDGSYNPNDCTGIFDEKKDKYGKIRKKYDILVKSLHDMGIDLKGIGDMYH